MLDCFCLISSNRKFNWHHGGNLVVDIAHKKGKTSKTCVKSIGVTYLYIYLNLPNLPTFSNCKPPFSQNWYWFWQIRNTHPPSKLVWFIYCYRYFWICSDWTKIHLELVKLMGEFTNNNYPQNLIVLKRFSITNIKCK